MIVNIWTHLLGRLGNTAIVLALLAGCGHGDRASTEPHPCDPSNGDDPPATQPFQRELRAAEAGMVCTTPWEPPEDATHIDASCEEVAEHEPTIPAALRCYRTCVPAARLAAATSAYLTLVDALRAYPARFAAAVAAGRCPYTARPYGGDGAIGRTLWTCAGMAEPPSELSIEVHVVPQGKPPAAQVTEVRIAGPLWLGGPAYTFTYGETDLGCGWSSPIVQVVPPR